MQNATFTSGMYCGAKKTITSKQQTLNNHGLPAPLLVLIMENKACK